MDHLCYLCLVFAMCSRLFIAALWSPAGKGLTSGVSFLMFICVFVTFRCGILGQVWYLIVSIPNLCHLSYILCIYRVFGARLITCMFSGIFKKGFFSILSVYFFCIIEMVIVFPITLTIVGKTPMLTNQMLIMMD